MAAIREAEALTFANDTVHALQGYLFSSDDARAEFVAINSLANEPGSLGRGLSCNLQRAMAQCRSLPSYARESGTVALFAASARNREGPITDLRKPPSALTRLGLTQNILGNCCV